MSVVELKELKTEALSALRKLEDHRDLESLHDQDTRPFDIPHRDKERASAICPDDRGGRRRGASNRATRRISKPMAEHLAEVALAEREEALRAGRLTSPLPRACRIEG